MSYLLVHAVTGYAILTGLFALVHVVANKPFTNALFYAIAVLEIALIAGLVCAIVGVIVTDRSVRAGLLFTYLVTMVAIPPVSVLWGIAEKSRWGTGVVTVALLSIAVLCERSLAIWAGQ